MSSNFSFSIAKPSDDDELRAIMRKISMPGPISLAFYREPSFFIAENIGCIKSETIVCKRNNTEKIVGFGTRSLWNVYINHEKKTIWYLHSLRSLDGENNGILLLRAYKYFHSLSNDSDFPYFLTTILDDNKYAKKVLESGRVGMPIYTKIGTIITHLIPLNAKKKVNRNKVNTKKCKKRDLPLAYSCVSEWNHYHDFTPAYNLNEIENPGKLLLDFSFENLYVSLSEKQINGTLGIWDQQSFKQLVVTDYNRKMKIARYFYNFYCYLKNLPRLPKKGEPIKMLYSFLISVEHNDPFIFNSLLEKVIYDWSGCGYDWFALGLRKGSPLEKTIAKKSKRQITSSAYLVYWNDNNVILPEITDFHLEIAFL